MKSDLVLGSKRTDPRTEPNFEEGLGFYFDEMLLTVWKFNRIDPTDPNQQGVSLPSRLAPPEVIESSDGGIVAAIRKLATRYSSRSASSFKKPAKKKKRKILDLTSGTFKWPAGGGGVFKKGKRKTQQKQQGSQKKFSLKHVKLLGVVASLETTN